jgi:hypothetical protein
MMLSELIETLQEIYENKGDAEVRLATQENWPFENRIQNVVDGAEIGAEEPDEEDADGAYADYVYIVEGRQLGYFTKAAWNC